MKRIAIAISIAFFAYSLPAFSTTLTFTGAELFSDPNVSFPASPPVPTVSGSSLDFGPDTDAWGKMLELPIIPAGSLSSLPATISVSINLTRLTADWDPKIMLSDGTSIVGANLSDNLPGVTWFTTADGGSVGTNVNAGAR